MNKERKEIKEMTEEEFEKYIVKLNSKKILKEMRFLLLFLCASVLGIVILLKFTIFDNQILVTYLMSFVSFFLMLMAFIDLSLKESGKFLFDICVLLGNTITLILIH